MEKKIEKKINTYLSCFKEEIKTKSSELGLTEDYNYDKLLQFIYDKENLKLSKEDFMKRKRIKNVINIFERCIAKRANGENCSRRKKGDSQYCGTHIKGTPHGIVDENNEDNTNNFQKVEVYAQDIQGIIHYIDNKGNVYQMEDVMQNKVNPRCTAKYEKINGNYSILYSEKMPSNLDT